MHKHTNQNLIRLSNQNSLTLECPNVLLVVLVYKKKLRKNVDAYFIEITITKSNPLRTQHVVNLFIKQL